MKKEPHEKEHGYIYVHVEMRKRLFLENSSRRMQYDMQRIHTVNISFIAPIGSLLE